LVRYGFEDVRLDRIIAQTIAVNAASRAVMEGVGLTYVRTFPTSMTVPVEGVDEREVEYEITREQWESADPTGMPGAARFGRELAGDLQ
jgi:RimJ/RimL family protein N-acetyltransferase